ncbi:SWIM zinc finger family protein [Streptomyces uncialis]|uniref:SWIM zinc finger family protein n=1 Tax=Streptomyces uncialis TaxID=1048205 RepID=UPI003798C4AF
MSAAKSSRTAHAGAGQPPPRPASDGPSARPSEAARQALYAARRARLAAQAGDPRSPGTPSSTAPSPGTPAMADTSTASDRLSVPVSDTSAAVGAGPASSASAAGPDSPGDGGGGAAVTTAGADASTEVRGAPVGTDPTTDTGASTDTSPTEDTGATTGPAGSGRPEGDHIARPPRTGDAPSTKDAPPTGDALRSGSGDDPAPRPATAPARPGDIAREALRAARARTAADETRVHPTAPARKAPRHPRLPAPPAPTTESLTRVDPRAARPLTLPARLFEAVPDLADLALAHLDAERGPLPQLPPSPRPAPPGPKPLRPVSAGSGPSPLRDLIAHVTPPTLSRDLDTPGPGTPTPVTPRPDPAPAERSSGAGPSADPASAAEPFAATWWGNAWVRALEDGALDAGRLGRGREYAEKGNVGSVKVMPGRVLAYVQGSRPRPYRTQIRLRTLTDDEWDAFLDTAADEPGRIAALLDRDMPHSLADGEVPLLPGAQDLDPSCGCPDQGRPCKHAAALAYRTARLLDENPFVLLLLRGRTEDDLLTELSRRNAARTAREKDTAAPFPGVRARAAFAAEPPPALPSPMPAPRHPEQPPAYPSAPGGPDPFALDQLATDAAARAYALLTTGRDPLAGLTLWQDAVRIAAARPGSGLTAASRALYASLAEATGRTVPDLGRAVAAWRQGGSEGLAVLETPWDPPAGRFDLARPALLAAALPVFRPWRNQLTHPGGHAQLRLGRDGLWYAYESEPGEDDWWPRGTPDLDPVGALTGLALNPSVP